jgi:hypothetical protein
MNLNTISLPYKVRPTNIRGKFEMLAKFVKCKVWTLMLLRKIFIRCGCDQMSFATKNQHSRKQQIENDH